MRKIIALLAAGAALALVGCAPLYPSTPAAPDARIYYVGGYVKHGGVKIHARLDVQLSAIGGKADANPDPGRPGAGGFGGIPDGPVSSPWERNFAIERNYDKSVTVNLNLTYIAPAHVADELTCYISTKSVDAVPEAEWESSIIDRLTVRSNANKGGSSVLLAYCLAQIKPLTGVGE